MLTSIVILTYNQIEYTKLCIESIRRFTKIGTYEMIVVDNASTDGTIEWLKQQDDIKTIFNSENLGFPKGCNQGIEISTGDNILLLNNDTVVTQNWLDNLLTCLYSADDIGAVGPVTNSASYYSTVPVNYTSIDEMHRFAELFNKSNKESWEQRLKLIGFCMLIKRKVIEKIGLLDEQFTPGNYEDDDYSFRIQQAGYKLILCKDTFIHHYGGTSFRKDIDKYSKLLKINEEKFQEKWGFNPAYSTNIRNEIINLIDTPRETAINVLEIGCACGGTLLKIKDLYKKANIYGIEFNENSSLIASQFASVKAQDAQKEMDYPKDYFDYIILADVLEHLYDPWSVMKNIRKYLKENGKVLISIPNVMHYTLLKDLINGNWTYTDAGLDKTHIRFFTLNEINKMLLEADYSNIELGYITVGKTEEDELFIQKLTKISNSSMETQYNANQYIIRATKSESKIKLEKILKSIENILPNDEDVKSELDLAELELFDTEEIITNIMMHLEKKVETLNYIAITNYGKGYLEDVLPYLKKALELKSDDSDTLYNLIFVLISFGELDLAKQFFRSSTKKNKELILLYKEIVQQEPIYNFLKKLEINPSDVESKLQLKTMIANDNSLLNEIKEIIEIVFNNKINLYSLLGVEFINGIIKGNREILEESNQLGTEKFGSLNDSVELPIGRKKFVTLFPETENVHLTKDVGMIGYILNKYYGYSSTIACYQNGDYPYLEKEVNGLQLDFIQNTGNSIEDGKNYLINNALQIDILHVFHLTTRSLVWIQTYKTVNPRGKVYLKLDADSGFMKLKIEKNVIHILEMCDVISVETKKLYKYLNDIWPLRHYNMEKEWPLRIEYIPNGFFDYRYCEDKDLKVEFKEKENIISTVGRIGSVQKANEILLEAFKLASPQLPNWKLNIIGPLEEQFIPYIERFFTLNPELQEKIIFTGNIEDKEQLEKEYKKAKIFCLTSRWEGFPLVFTEAAKNGCYLISSDILPAWDITDDGKYGEIFEIDNIEQLSQILVRSCNDEVLIQNCYNIQEYAYSNFYWPKICKEVLRLLNEI